MDALEPIKQKIYEIRGPHDSKICNTAITIYKELLKVYLVVGFILRIVLMCSTPEDSSLGIWDIVKALVVGAVNDVAMSTVLCIPILLLCLGWNDWKYRRQVAIPILALLALLFGYVTFTHSVFHEYGSAAPAVAQAFVGYKLASFALRFFLPRIRKAWRTATIYLLWAVMLFLLLGNTIAEWFFWDEFGVRYNFIAVDYLIYTNEVVGNIMESYSIVPLLILVAVMTATIIWLTTRRVRFRTTQASTPWQLALHVAVALAAIIVSWFYLSRVSHRLESDNYCASQIQQNGCYDFVEAFQSNKLDYAQFYAMIPERQCREVYRQLTALDTRQQTDTIAAYWLTKLDIPTENVNVVLITVESLSASFLSAYGNEKHITPNLDTLMQHSMVFDHLYAVGNRTVRGLEALSLCIPPSVGESIVKRQENRCEGRTVGHLLSRRGYQTLFLYGGDSYFDNMGDYFGNNSYEVIDRSAISHVTFANIWGVCDEDLYAKALQVFDEQAKASRPFFAQLMTVSNHRPYTFPEGKIQFEGDPMCRDGAVKYTDFAIGQFLKEARSHEWYDRTVFVIIADHCASSAGKTSIPVEKYHIPCIIYAPSMIQPCHVSTLCSQIDIIPTLLAMLHTDEPTPFTGRNVLSEAFWPRAFMATYQDLGYLENDVLTVLSAKRQVKQFRVEVTADGTHTETLMQALDTTLVKKAQAYYQHANLYIMGM